MAFAGPCCVGVLAAVLAARARAGDEAIRLPATDAHFGPVKDYVEAVPDPDYRHAPPAAIEAFRDLKYGVRIHWGLYSAAFEGGESWPFLDLPYDEEAGVPAGVPDLEPAGLRRRGVDAPLRGERPAHVRVHVQAPRRLLDVRHAHARQAAGELDGSRRSAARGLRPRPTASRRRRSGATSSGSSATPRTGTASRSTSTSRTPTGTTRTSGPTASRRSRRRAPRSTRSSTAAPPSPREPASSSSPRPSPRPRSRTG